MRGLPRTRWIAGAAVLALALSACGGGDDDSGDDGDGGSGEPVGAVTYDSCEPENPLIPANTNETCGGDPLDAIFTKLVGYNVETAEPEMAVAESIESEDSQNWTIKIKDGWTFHDGTPVTASSFVDAWNWAASGVNANQNQYWFGEGYLNVVGFADVAGEDANGDEVIQAEEQTATEMSGLKVVDDLTFTVELGAPFSSFVSALGYTVFSPLPEVFYEDTAAFGELPVGNGPFQMVSYEPEVAINLTAYPDYAGDDKPKVKDFQFKIYADLDAAYADLVAGNLDVMQNLPPTALAGDTYKTDLGDRYIDKSVGTITTISFPLYDPKFQNADLRKAISMAIDRETITQNIFAGTRTPATSWASPVVEGYTDGACGEACEYDPEAAKATLDQAGGFEGTLTLSYNADGGHKEWTEATCISIANALGIDCQATPYVDFASLRADVNERKMTGMFRTGWQMDYPALDNFFAPLYVTNASSNDSVYSNPEFDALVQQGVSASPEEAPAIFQEAEAILAVDLPAIPMWTTRQISGYAETVSNVQIDPFSRLVLTTVEKN